MRSSVLPLISFLFFALTGSIALGQSLGLELKNALMPASGALGGASVARPQDLQSAINGNPATLTQFRGTQFSFGGAWVEATYNVNQLSRLPLLDVDPFGGKSSTPGGALANIGVTQDITALGLPATLGIGFVSNAGAGVDFRSVPESNGTSTHYTALDLVSSVGVDMTDRWSVGGALMFGTAFLDGPFVDTGGMVPDYALRGSFGTNFTLTPNTWIGGYWQSKKGHTFDDAALIGNLPATDIRLEHPANFSLGVGNNRLADGRLLLMMDVVFMNYSDTAFLGAIFDDQWACQFGSQFEVTDRFKLRLGYSYNENPMAAASVASLGGVTVPDGIPGVRYVQGQFAAITQHRLTAGFGLLDVLPGMDLDLFGGGAFKNDDQFGSTQVNVKAYWVGFGLTWRFGRGSGSSLGIPNTWGS